MNYNITSLYTTDAKLRSKNLQYFNLDKQFTFIVYGCQFCGYQLKLFNKGTKDNINIIYNGLGGILLKITLEYLLDIINNFSLNESLEILNNILKCNYINDKYNKQIDYLNIGIRYNPIVKKVTLNLKSFIEKLVKENENKD